jgi:hypothetical protein
MKIVTPVPVQVQAGKNETGQQNGASYGNQSPVLVPQDGSIDLHNLTSNGAVLITVLPADKKSWVG